MKRSIFLLAAAASLLSACSGGIIPNGGPSTASTTPAAPVTTPDKPAKPIPSTPDSTLPPAAATGDGTTAASLGVVRGPAIATLKADKRKTDLAFASFKTSCPGLVRRTDSSGLTQGADWVSACEAAKTWSGDSLSFFATYLDAVQVGDGKAHATGYFEPEILGSRTKRPGYEVPIYKRPDNLIDVDLGQFSDDMKGKSIRGKVQGTKFIPYDDRAQIEDGSLQARGLEIAYAADVVDFFFLQIQGSGRLKQPDGSIMRIGYESQNGRGYTGIGKLMKDRGLITDGSMQGIVAYLRANPEEGRKIMQENKSFVFFRELTGAGPLGAMGYPVVGEASVAADTKFVPLGAPVWLSMDRAEPNGLWIAQDTGGAIKGANRIDTFWGAGDRAKAIAGGMSARGSALLFLPKASVARLLPTP